MAESQQQQQHTFMDESLQHHTPRNRMKALALFLVSSVTILFVLATVTKEQRSLKAAKKASAHRQPVTKYPTVTPSGSPTTAPTLSPQPTHSPSTSLRPSTQPSLRPSTSSKPTTSVEEPSTSVQPSANPSSVPSASAVPSHPSNMSPVGSLEPSQSPTKSPLTVSLEPSQPPTKSSMPSSTIESFSESAVCDLRTIWLYNSFWAMEDSLGACDWIKPRGRGSPVWEDSWRGGQPTDASNAIVGVPHWQTTEQRLWVDRGFPLNSWTNWTLSMAGASLEGPIAFIVVDPTDDCNTRQQAVLEGRPKSLHCDKKHYFGSTASFDKLGKRAFQPNTRIFHPVIPPNVYHALTLTHQTQGENSSVATLYQDGIQVGPSIEINTRVAIDFGFSNLHFLGGMIMFLAFHRIVFLQEALDGSVMEDFANYMKS